VAKALLCEDLADIRQSEQCEQLTESGLIYHVFLTEVSVEFELLTVNVQTVQCEVLMSVDRMYRVRCLHTLDGI
jgi:hypothetical protein